MSYLFLIILLIAIAALAVMTFLAFPPARIVSFVRVGGPAALVVLGVLATVFGRGGVGIPLIGLGVVMWARNRSARPLSSRSSAPKSTVRTAALEMELDHETGEMDGNILFGEREGERLSGLDEDGVLELYRSLETDPDSQDLLEAYLDRRFAGWREHGYFDRSAGQAGSSGSGPMGKEEAYQILGLAPGAGADEIREAHRRLIKRIHPDSGGSTFLAAKINEAKDLLLK